MREYTRRDFSSYYNGSFIRDPDNMEEIGQIVWDRYANNGEGGLKFYKGVADYRKLGSEGIKALPLLDHTLLEWEHVCRPPLGYRHLKDGKELFYASICRRTHTAKGLNDSCVSLDIPPQVRAVNKAIGLPDVDYIQLNLESAKELHHPHYLTTKEAIAKLSSDKLCVGFALSQDVAVVLGTSKNQPFLMLFKGNRIAQSSDGKTWILNNEEYRGVLERHAK